MGQVVPFPKSKFLRPDGLTHQECDAVLSALVRKGLSTYFSLHDGGRYMSVYDTVGDQYFIGRKDTIYHLFGPDEKRIVQTREFDCFLQGLEAFLEPMPELPS